MEQHPFFFEESKTKIIYPIGGYAPGHYSNKCSNCESRFMGDKYARQCEPCAINAVNKHNAEVTQKLHTLMKALEGIKFGSDKINEILKNNEEKNN